MRVLMVSRARGWLGPPRLLHALTKAGAATAWLGHASDLIASLRRVGRGFVWTDGRTMDWRDLHAAVDAFRPDRLLAADDPTVYWLLDLVMRADLPDALANVLAAWVGGDPEHVRVATDKLATTRLAAELGIDVPVTVELDRDADAGAFVHREGWPVVIKSRRGFAGIDVFPCASLRDLRIALKHCPRQQGRLIQRFQSGVTWMSLVVAEKGKLLGQISLAKEHQYPEWVGPSSLVRSEFDADLLAVSERMVAALGFTGFGSLDFLFASDGRKYLLELNPRLVPASHLGRLLGVDLVKSFVHQRPCDPRQVMRGRRIALFPQELRRQPDGQSLAGCYHDVPWDEPELVSAICDLLEPGARCHLGAPP